MPPLPPRILILGNSHSQALADAAKGADDVEVHWLKVKAEARHGTLEMAAAQDKIAALDPGDRLVLLHLGAQHNVKGLLNHDQPFALADVAAREGGDSAGLTLIPRAAMREELTRATARETLVRRLKARAPCPVCHVMTPPPKRDLTMPDNAGKAYRGRSILEIGFAPAPHRLALWQLEQEVIAEYLASLGVIHLAPPEGTTTTEGYLDPAFDAGDNTHANTAYGAKVLDQVRATFD